MSPKKSSAALKVDPDCSTSLEPFWQRVAETIAWCLPRVDQESPRDCLRTPSIRGRTLVGNYHDCVSNVATARRQELSPSRPEPVRGLAGGRLLIYFPDADLCDGAAECESQGFLDVYNTPPWDTWVAFVSEPVEKNISYSEYLVAWVPHAFVGLAAAGILVNPEECIRWLDESRVLFAELVESSVR